MRCGGSTRTRGSGGTRAPLSPRRTGPLDPTSGARRPASTGSTYPRRGPHPSLSRAQRRAPAPIPRARACWASRAQQAHGAQQARARHGSRPIDRGAAVAGFKFEQATGRLLRRPPPPSAAARRRRRHAANDAAGRIQDTVEAAQPAARRPGRGAGASHGNRQDCALLVARRLRWLAARHCRSPLPSRRLPSLTRHGASGASDLADSDSDVGAARPAPFGPGPRATAPVSGWSRASRHGHSPFSAAFSVVAEDSSFNRFVDSSPWACFGPGPTSVSATASDSLPDSAPVGPERVSTSNRRATSHRGNTTAKFHVV